MDIDRIRAENADRTDVERKSGLIIWSGRKLVLRVALLISSLALTMLNVDHLFVAANPNKLMRDEWRKEAQAKYAILPVDFCQ